MNPPEWYGTIKQDIGRIQGQLTALTKQVSNLSARLENHLANDHGQRHSKPKQMAVASGKYGSVAAIVYVLLEVLRRYVGM